MGRLKAAAYTAVPDVIEKGIVYAKEKNWKDRGYDTAVLIANIEIGKEKYVCEVVVKQGVTRQGFYLHEVALKKDLEDVFKTVNDSTPSRSKLILAQYLEKGKKALGKLDENGEPLVTEVQKYIQQKGITLNQMSIDNAAFKKWFGNRL